MTDERLTGITERVRSWRNGARQELADVTPEIEAALQSGSYHPTPPELAGIDRGLQAAELGRFATPDDLATLFAKHRPA